MAKDKPTIYLEEDFVKMRKVGCLAAEILDLMYEHVKPGVTTDELNEIAEEYTKKYGAVSGPLGYKGYPKSICTSVNHEICHGIPSDKVLKEGDIINIDVTPILDGYYGDSSRMYCVGEKVSVKAKKLTEVTYQCMIKAINVVKPGVPFSEIGRVIQAHAEENGFSVVRDFVGHETGKFFHGFPVFHYYEPQYDKFLMQEGMIFTVEPMINAGKDEAKILSDGWTAVTRDKSLSAQFEHTLGVTKNGAEIFTLSPKGLHKPEA
jgi:methionyl aminopeptidase